MKKRNKKATAKKTVPAVAPKTVKRTPLFINPDGTISSSYADAIAWDKDKPNS